MRLQAPGGGRFATPRKWKSKRVETKSEREIRAHCGLTIFEIHIWSNYLVLCGRVSGALNLAVGLWSLRNKCNHSRGRPACLPRFRGSAASGQTRRSAPTPDSLVALFTQRPLTHGMFGEYFRVASATAEFNRR